MIKLSWILFICMGVFAENQPQAPAQGGQQGVQGNPNTLNAFDRGFFEAKSEKSNDLEPDYNAGNVKQWKEMCSVFKGKDPKAYRDCYQTEKKKTIDSVNRQREDVGYREGASSKDLERKLQNPKTEEEQD